MEKKKRISRPLIIGYPGQRAGNLVMTVEKKKSSKKDSHSRKSPVKAR